MNSNSVGSRIAQRRLELGLTQHAVAQAIGRKQATISYIESGGRNPSLGMLNLIARELRVSMSQLVEGM